jgi:hypothetical protein
MQICSSPKFNKQMSTIRVANFLAVLLILSSRVASAQADSAIDWEHRTNVSVAAAYISNNVFLGRKDTVAIPYYTPSVAFTLSNGLYLRAEANYTTARGGRWDEEVIELGYNFKEGSHWGGALSLDKYFYNKSSTATGAAITAAFAGEVYYNTEIATPGLNVMALFSQKSDVVFNPYLAHEFDFLNERVSLSPMIALNWGTQHYYDAYLKRLNNIPKKGADTVLKEAGAFKLRDYELSIDARGQLKKWEMGLARTYVVPVNPATITLPNRDVTEKLSNTFLVALTVIYHAGLHPRRRD